MVCLYYDSKNILNMHLYCYYNCEYRDIIISNKKFTEI